MTGDGVYVDRVVAAFDRIDAQNRADLMAFTDLYFSLLELSSRRKAAEIVRKSQKRRWFR